MATPPKIGSVMKNKQSCLFLSNFNKLKLAFDSLKDIWYFYYTHIIKLWE